MVLSYKVTETRDSFKTDCCSEPLANSDGVLAECRTCGRLWRSIDMVNGEIVHGWFSDIVCKCEFTDCPFRNTAKCLSCVQASKEYVPRVIRG